MKNSILLFFVLFLVSCGSFQQKAESEQKEKIVVTAVNYPLYYFAGRIGGDLIQTEYPIPQDVDPAYWIPGDEALAVYQSADVILANGADYAKWMHNVSLPLSRIVNTSKAFEDSYIQLKQVSTHSHGPEGEHEHTGYAFTTWLDFDIAAGQAEAVMKALLDKLPDDKDILEKNYLALQNDLAGLNDKMIQLSKEIGDQHLIGSHPVYQYFSKAYGLHIHSVHFEPDEMPTHDQWHELDHLLEHYPSSVMLWEGEPLSELTEMLDTKGMNICVFNPCGNKPETGDFLESMKNNIKSLKDNILQ